MKYFINSKKGKKEVKLGEVVEFEKSYTTDNGSFYSKESYLLNKEILPNLLERGLIIKEEEPKTCNKKSPLPIDIKTFEETLNHATIAEKLAIMNNLNAALSVMLKYYDRESQD